MFAQSDQGHPFWPDKVDLDTANQWLIHLIPIYSFINLLICLYFIQYFILFTVDYNLSMGNIETAESTK